ncbi:Cysteine proteinase inhibitor 12 [Nymphaea thermarum]|nr:Cysteine proteinase inhibitor 12 [Nymphaea thermarum]
MDPGRAVLTRPGSDPLDRPSVAGVASTARLPNGRRATKLHRLASGGVGSAPAGAARAAGPTNKPPAGHPTAWMAAGGSREDGGVRPSPNGWPTPAETAGNRRPSSTSLFPLSAMSNAFHGSPTASDQAEAYLIPSELVHGKITVGSSRVRAARLRSLSDGEEENPRDQRLRQPLHDPGDHYHFIMRTITDSTHQRVRNCVPTYAGPPNDLTMASFNSSSTTLGGFQPIPDVKNNKHVQELGKFAVAEFNKKHQEAAALVFVEVVEAQSQVVAGTNYRLLIKTLKAGYVRHYKALVYEKTWEDVKTLTSFEPVFP